MALKYSTTVRNAKLDAIKTAIGASPIMAMFTGAAPANTATANSGTVIATINLPSDWMAAASDGSKSKTGTWEDTSADNSGQIGHFRIFVNGGSTCHIQGTCSNTGDGGDMTFDNVVVTAGQTITISTFTITDNNG